MPEVAYLSASGEIKIPLKVRTKLGLKAGQKFDVQIKGQDIKLVQLDLPSAEQIKEFVAWRNKNEEPDQVVIPGTKTNGAAKTTVRSAAPKRKKATAR